MKPPPDPEPRSGRKRLMQRLMEADAKTAQRAKKYKGPGTTLSITPGNRDEKPVFHYETKGRKGPKHNSAGKRNLET